MRMFVENVTRKYFFVTKCPLMSSFKVKLTRMTFSLPVEGVLFYFQSSKGVILLYEFRFYIFLYIHMCQPALGLESEQCVCLNIRNSHSQKFITLLRLKITSQQVIYMTLRKDDDVMTLQKFSMFSIFTLIKAFACPHTYLANIPCQFSNMLMLNLKRNHCREGSVNKDTFENLYIHQSRNMCFMI